MFFVSLTHLCITFYSAAEQKETGNVYEVSSLEVLVVQEQYALGQVPLLKGF